MEKNLAQTLPKTIAATSLSFWVYIKKRIILLTGPSLTF